MSCHLDYLKILLNRSLNSKIYELLWACFKWGFPLWQCVYDHGKMRLVSAPIKVVSFRILTVDVERESGLERQRNRPIGRFWR